MAARVYATSADYQTYTGQTPPSDITKMLADATRMLESKVFRLCWFVADSVTGMPTNALVLAAFKEAVCAQAEWGDETGDTIGAAAAGWGSVELGSAKLSRSVTKTSGADAPGRQIADKVWDSLQSPDLTPDIFQLGAVSS